MGFSMKINGKQALKNPNEKYRRNLRIRKGNRWIESSLEWIYFLRMSRCTAGLQGNLKSIAGETKENH